MNTNLLNKIFADMYREMGGTVIVERVEPVDDEPEDEFEDFSVFEEIEEEE